MGRARPDLIEVWWENPPGGVYLIKHHRGRAYEMYVSKNGHLTQIETAAVLDVSVMTVNRLVRAGRLPDVERDGISQIPLREVKRLRRERHRKER